MARRPAPLPYNATPEQYQQYLQEWSRYQDELAAENAAAVEARRVTDERVASENRAYQQTQDDRDWQAKKDELDLKKRQLEEVGIPTAKIERWYKEQQAQLARDTLIEDRRQFDVGTAEKARQFNATTGLDYLKTAASLSGADNVFEAADFARGVRQRGEVPQFLKELQSSAGAQLSGGAYSAQPTPLTIDTLKARLTGGNGGASTGTSQEDEAARALAAVTQIGMNPNKVRGVENLLPTEQKILGSGLRKAGFNEDDWLAQYKQGGAGFGTFGAAA